MTKHFLWIALTITGCAQMDKALTGASSMPSQDERAKKVDQFPNLTADQKQKFINGEPWISMSQTELAAMWGSEPAKRQKKLTAKGNGEVQLYKVRVGDWKSGIQTKYYKVTIIEGKVAELQELDENVGSLDKL